jgi:soluble P-type ATPase
MEIPGRGEYTIACLVLDMNGTIATDGRIPDKVRDKINLLAKVVRLDAGKEAPQKEQFIKKLGPDKTIAVGNGYNDHLMVREAAVGIAVIGTEGAARETIANADVVVNEMVDALDLILKPLRHQATLRK